MVVDLIGGEYITHDLHLPAEGGRVVAVSIAAGTKTPLPLGLLMSKRAGLMGTVLRPRSTREKAELISDGEHHVVPLLRDGALEQLSSRSARLNASRTHSTTSDAAAR